MKRQETVLVCGAAGFIGSHACRALAAAGYVVACVSRTSPAGPVAKHAAQQSFIGDLKDRAFAERVLQAVKPHRIIFAAGPADVQQSMEDPARDFAEQSMPLLNVLAASRKANRPPGILLVSSAAVYGQPTALPVSETASATPLSPYGFHKLMQESMLAEFRALYGIPTCSARAFSTLGPGQRRLAVWDITRRAMRGVLDLPGTGEESRDYLYADDLARALVYIVSRGRFEGEIYNVASGREVLIRELAREVFASLGIHGEPRFTGVALPGSPARWRADISRLRSLGFEPETKLEEAVARTVDWIRRHD